MLIFRSHCPSKVPDHFEMLSLPNEVFLWPTALLHRLLEKLQLFKKHTGLSLVVAQMNKPLSVYWPCQPFPPQILQACTKQATWSLCSGYVGSKIFKEISCSTCSRLNRCTISHICQTFREHGRPDPSLDDNGRVGFLLQWELRAFEIGNLVEKYQKAIPMSVISTLAKTKISETDHVIVQLTGLGVFFAFWSCEYLKVQRAEEGQTQALCLRNIQFFQDGTSLPHSNPDLEFTNCISITFKQQKQKEKNNTVTQQASGDSVLCPVHFAKESFGASGPT
jgi:hypothetical protein